MRGSFNICQKVKTFKSQTQWPKIPIPIYSYPKVKVIFYFVHFFLEGKIILFLKKASIFFFFTSK